MALFTCGNGFNQQPGLALGPEEFLANFIIPQMTDVLFRTPNHPRQCRKQNQTSGATVKCDKDQFQMSVDVKQFTPEEVTVKVVDNSIVVEGKHEEKQDEHGFISRQFVRRFVLPEGHDIEQISSSLSIDGVLTITAPKISTVENKERVIPITRTGPHKIVKDSKKEDKQKEEK